ncbi:hypothetical protein Psi02_08610 [Planotetraspora silvatica]|uniref:Tat pathway signal sequence domain protein n=1 Tax=Planotetraspora silvatica TaxID=234614 RepID=A0A8J3XJP1_9ACTN|nr:hypothetical protein [Planotetraspora silvatica]GII44437.1 hypothetical protein Psi02_08610 [Planotetraspora silvatica]
MSALMRKRAISVFLAALAVVTVSGTTTAHAAAKAKPVSPITIVKKAKKVPTWKVTITGRAGGHAFKRTGVVRLASTRTRVTTNGINKIDVCLISGTPSVRPQTGAIHFGSNAACYGYRTRVDMGYVKVSGGTVSFTPDSRLSATFVNNHTDSNGLLACIYYPVSGKGSYTFYSNGTIRGKISYRGFAGLGCDWSSYSATITGRRIQ